MSKQCPQCGAENADDSKFCLQCGAPLPASSAPAGGAPAPDQITCPACGAHNAAGSRFCLSCGHALAGGAAGPSASTGTSEPGQVGGSYQPGGPAQSGGPAQPGFTASTSYPQQPHYAPVAPQENPISAALHDIAGTPGGIGRMALLALIGMVPILNFSVTGYVYRWSADLLRGNRRDMPRTIVGDGNIKLGFFCVLVSVALGIAAGLVGGIICMPLDAIGLGIVGDAIVFIISLAVGLFAGVCCLNMALTEKLGDGFEFSKVWQGIMRDAPGALFAYVIPAVAFQLLSLGVSLLLALILAPSMVTLILTGEYSAIALVTVLGAAGLFTFVNLLASMFISAAQSVITARALGHWAARAVPEWGGQRPVLTSGGAPWNPQPPSPAPGPVLPMGGPVPPAGGPAPVASRPAPTGGAPVAGPAPAPAPAPMPAPTAPAAPAAAPTASDTITCPQCGKANSADNKFCLGCGTPLVAAAPAPVPVLESPATPESAPAPMPSAPQQSESAPTPAPVPAPIPAPQPNPFEAPEPDPTPTGSDAGTTLLVPTITLLRTNGKRYTIASVPATLGKGSAADVLIEGNEAISRVHARILYAGEQFVIEDMGSSNKTYINGDVLAPHDPVALRDGDTLRLANEEFTVWIA